jgi:hypothetical protein
VIAGEVFAQGDLIAAKKLLKKQINTDPANRKMLRRYLERVQSLQRSVNIAREDLKARRFSSALIQISVIEDAFLALARDMGVQFDLPIPASIDGFDIQAARNRIGDPVLFLFLTDSYKIAKVYINGNPVRFMAFQGAYVASSVVAFSDECLVQVTDTRGKVRKIRVSTAGNLQDRNPAGFWLVNNHTDTISVTADGKEWVLKPGQRTLLPNPDYVILACGAWGNFRIDRSLIYPGNNRVSRLRVIHVK